MSRINTLHCNYKVIYDPELDSSLVKQSNIPILEYESIIRDKPQDPRPSKVDYEKKSRLYTTLFQVVDFDKKQKYTENNHQTVLVSNISPLSTESQIITVLSVYGTVLGIEIIKDPFTGGPLGLANVTFIDKASALRAVKDGNGRRVVISDAIQIEFDMKGDKMKAAIAASAAVFSPADKIPDHSEDVIKKPLILKRYSSIPSADADQGTRTKPSRWGKPMTDFIHKSYQDYRSKPIYQEKRDTPPPLPSDEQRSYTKAVISRKCLPFMRGALEELERIFYPFGYIDIYHDANNWFIIFESKSSALQAQQFIYDNNQRVIGYPIQLSIPAISMSTKVDHCHDTASSADLVLSAKKILFDQLADIFLKDLKNRIAGPCIYDFLNPSLTIKPPVEEHSFPLAATMPTTATTTITTAADALQSDIVAASTRQDDDHPTIDIYKLPRFKRKSILQPSFEPTSTPDANVHTTMPNKANLDIISTIIRPPSSLTIAQQAPLERRPSQSNQQKQDSSSSDEDFLGTTVSSTKQQPVQRKSFSVANRRLSISVNTSDSDSSIDNEEAYRRITSRKKKKPMLPKRRKSIAPTSTLPRKKASIHMVIEETPPVNSPSNMEIDIDTITPPPPAAKEPFKELEFDQALLDKILMDVGQPDPEVEAWLTNDEEMVTLNKEWDPFYQTKDVEDLEYLRVALVEKVPEITDLAYALDHIEKRMSQSARTRGYYPIPDSVKATYLNKNKALFEPPPSLPLLPLHPRHHGMMMTAELDVLDCASPFKRPKRRLELQKSPIHEWGLYAKEPIQANEMVIEYIGEVVHLQVARKRECEYKRCGIVSIFLFRVDEDLVIDATKKGNMARFINHCCTPNCTAKIVKVDQQKRVVIYANRDIEIGEEITYDYKFPREIEKMPCLCGSKFCKGTLN